MITSLTKCENNILHSNHQLTQKGKKVLAKNKVQGSGRVRNFFQMNQSDMVIRIFLKNL